MDTELDTEAQADLDEAEETESAEEQEQEAALAETLETRAEEEEEEETEGEEAQATTPGLGATVETGATAESAGVPEVAAPTQISAKKAKKKQKAFKAKEKERKKQQRKRKSSRQKKDWTAKELANLTTAQGAQGVLVALNKRSPAQGIKCLKDAGAWDTLIAALPKGKMTQMARAAVGGMVMDDLLDIEDCKKLFEKRFGHAAQDVGKAWTLPIMQVLWRQLDLLPESDVALNTAVTTFDAIAGGGGFGPSWEAPDTINTIQLGVDTTDYQHLEHTVRHEVAHGVHTQIPGPINEWLKNDMQFWFIDFDQFITDLGGYPAKYTPPSEGTERAVTPDEKSWIKDLIENQYCGSGSWDPVTGVSLSAAIGGTDADTQALWNAIPAALRNACDQSTSHWYQNYENFQVKNGKRYFLNHWYHRPFTIGGEAMKAIPTTNDNYTAMSEKEFFANCYAEYFENPEGAKDQTKWGGGLSAGIKDFFKSCIIQRNPYTKFKKDQKDAQGAAKGAGTPGK
jgi:hypothetical protein